LTNIFLISGIWVKLALVFSTYSLCYFGIYYFQSEPLFAQLYAILMGLCGVMLVFNVVHDASHNALLKSKKTNQWLCYLGDLVGINTYIWDIRHNIQHHSFTNILGGDLIVENIPLIRLTPAAKWHGFHKLQIFYAPILYSLYSLYWTLGIDFKLFFKKEICNMRNITHTKKQWAFCSANFFPKT
jgi:linoleoyl-CoA desaturase